MQVNPSGVPTTDGQGEPMAHDRMTIGEAKAAYHDWHDQLGQLIRQMYVQAKAQNESIEFANDNYLDALQLTAMMMQNTQRHFRMFTGSTADDFLNDLSEPFTEMVRRLHGVGGKVQAIIVNADVRSSVLDALSNEFPNTIEVRYATAAKDRDVAHFIVTDDNSVRIEKPHDRLSDGEDANTVSARVIFNNEGLASYYRTAFEKLFASLARHEPAAGVHAGR